MLIFIISYLKEPYLIIMDSFCFLFECLGSGNGYKNNLIPVNINISTFLLMPGEQLSFRMNLSVL